MPLADILGYVIRQVGQKVDNAPGEGSLRAGTLVRIGGNSRMIKWRQKSKISHQCIPGT